MSKKIKTVTVQPKHNITSAKFGVSIYSNEQYKADVESKSRYLVHVGNGPIRLMVFKKDLLFKDEIDLENAIEYATDSILDEARGEVTNYASLDTSDDILYLRDEMNQAWSAVESVERSKNIKQVTAALTKYVGKVEAKEALSGLGTEK